MKERPCDCGHSRDGHDEVGRCDECECSGFATCFFTGPHPSGIRQCVGEAFRLADGVRPQEAAEAISRLTNLCAPLGPEWDGKAEAMSLVEGVDISTHGDKATFRWRENHGRDSCKVSLTTVDTAKLVGEIMQTDPDGEKTSVSGFRIGRSAWYIEFGWHGSTDWRYLIVAPEED